MFDGENRRYRMRNIYLLFCSTKGEEVYGVFKLKPNTRNVRDLDIEIDVDFQVKNMVTWSALRSWNIFFVRVSCAKWSRATSTRCGRMMTVAQWFAVP